MREGKEWAWKGRKDTGSVLLEEMASMGCVSAIRWVPSLPTLPC